MTDEIKHCYRILDLDARASPAEAKKAWLEFQKFYHPDRLQHDTKLLRSGQEKLKKINAAYDELKRYFSSADYCQRQTDPPPPRNSQRETPPQEAKTYSYSRPKPPPAAISSMTCFRCQGKFRFPAEMEGEFSSCPHCGGAIQLSRRTQNPNTSQSKPSYSQPEQPPPTASDRENSIESHVAWWKLALCLGATLTGIWLIIQYKWEARLLIIPLIALWQAVCFPKPKKAKNEQIDKALGGPIVFAIILVILIGIVFAIGYFLMK